MARDAAKASAYSRRYRAENQDKLRTYYRAYMADYRTAHPKMRVVVDRPNKCRYPHLCATKVSHRHCCCGLPIEPTAHACQVCIREQARRERRPVEIAA